MANLAALRAAVFSLSAKNLRGGVEINPPPPVRGLRYDEEVQISRHLTLLLYIATIALES